MIDVTYKFEKVEKPSFPVLRKYRNSNLVVMFITEESGTILVLDESDSKERLGKFEDDLISCWDMRAWEVITELTMRSD